ncbi:MAG: Nif3-like dinuclear metal center hexameric protein [Candidatus Borkfalkiaceae bacterium]|nr:Nif3-like dinuclear metal center hexameric protein [Christensenellaceae bacterium]
MKIKEIIEESERIAPLSYSFEAIEKGYYDNSGLLIDGGNNETDEVLFALDLTRGAFEAAKSAGAKLIFTHHPAIYKPIKNVSGLYCDCISSGISVYSAHLNLDIAKSGIDDGLCEILCESANGNVENFNPEIKEIITDGRGFGRAFKVKPQPLETLVNGLIGALNIKKYMLFGDEKRVIKRVASFCGAGLDEAAVENENEADLLVSADIPHHVLLAALEKNKCVLQLTHYSSEAFAFERFVKKLCKNLKIKTRFYFDERFL